MLMLLTTRAVVLRKKLVVARSYSPTSIIRPPFIRISLLSGRDREVIFFFNPMITIGKMMWFQTQSKFCLNWKWFSYHSNINNKHSRQISLAVTCNQTSNKQNIHRSTWAESFYEITARQKRSLIVIELNAWADWTQVCTQTVACDHAASCT